VSQTQKSAKSPAHHAPTWLLLIVSAVFTLFAEKTHALVLTNYFETILVTNVSTSWTTVSLDNNYSNAIPVCTNVLETFAGSAGNYTDPPAVTRIRNIGSSSFELRVQGWEDSAANTTNVHCVVMEAGAHTLPDGRLVEAHSVVSNFTNGQFATDGGWNLSLQEDVSSTIVHNYTNPVVLGQVMSHNDNRASVIVTSDCVARANYPFQSPGRICVGKQIGQVAGSRNPETVGYIVAEAGSGTVNNVFYELALGPDSVAGNNTANIGDFYALNEHHTTAVLTMGGVDGGNGGWAVLYGSDPLTDGSMQLVIDEEVVVSDMTRNHTAEHVFYWAFAGAEITLVKNVINDNNGSAVVADFPLSAAGATPITGISGQAAVTKAILQPGTYTLSETTLPGYAASDWVCSGATTAIGGKVELLSGDHATCTITNDDLAETKLTLVKEITNDAGGTAVVSDFILEYRSLTAAGSGVTGDASVTSVSVPPGLYSLGESTVAGYTLVGIKCDGKDADGSDGVELFDGEDVTCVFLNNDQGVDLTIAKSVSDTTPNVGDTLTFTLQIKNSGPDAATDFHVLDPIPAGFSYVASSMTGGDVRDDSSPSGTGLDWTINSLPSGSSASLTFQAIVLAP